jgi:hypothetical protein
MFSSYVYCGLTKIVLINWVLRYSKMSITGNLLYKMASWGS